MISASKPSQVPSSQSAHSSFEQVTASHASLRSRQRFAESTARYDELDLSGRLVLGSNGYANLAHERAPTLAIAIPRKGVNNNDAAEVAMAIAEEVARLSHAAQPVALDSPLKLSGMNAGTMVKLRSWLKSSYDYEESLDRLMDDGVTPEVLASDILASPKKRQPHKVVSQVMEQERQSPPQTVGSGSPPRSKRVRLMPRTSISVDVDSEPEEIPMVSTSTTRHQVASEIGMTSYESWAGKKAGLMVGLLAFGLMGSPASPSFRSVQSPHHPSALSFKPVSPLADVRAPMPSRTPIFASWLDSLRFPALESVQSPWIADSDKQYASLDGLCLSFPQTPRSF
ncbi:hypothetical protein A0H81_01951 [Grifola frondosa]|uniref:Uncharacterized protein n=1 Tax=Grifola frondosa TaxID=5627 RepID=A0A1C7MKP6_GRIFR|nr:hypothetical protein A0H81_01951 [Grifola frondosa]